jgi:actin-like protein 6A
LLTPIAPDAATDRCYLQVVGSEVDADGSGSTRASSSGISAATGAASSSLGGLAAHGPGGTQYGRTRKYAVDMVAPRPHMALRSPLSSAGLVEDWEAMESLLEYAFVERLHLAAGAAGAAASTGAGGSASAGSARMATGAAAQQAAQRGPPGNADLSLHPVLWADAGLAAKADRERLAQLLFETYRAPGVFMAKAGVLALYANARTTGLAVDMGGGGISLTPVQDGFPLMAGTRRHPLGGRALDAALQQAFAERLQGQGQAQAQGEPQAAGAGGRTAGSVGSLLPPQLPVQLVPNVFRGAAPPASGGAAAGSSSQPPPWQLAGFHRSVVAWHCLELVRAAKESVCRVSDTPFDAAAQANIAAVPYELPDGALLDVGVERFGVPELLFDPSPLAATYLGVSPLPTAIVSSVMACDPEVRRDLMAGLVLTGGASGLPGLADRLQRELGPVAPIGTKPRLAAAAPAERALGPWLGGSILASLGTFPDLWFTAEEYAEHGAKMMHRKCP